MSSNWCEIPTRHRPFICPVCGDNDTAFREVIIAEYVSTEHQPKGPDRVFSSVGMHYLHLSGQLCGEVTRALTKLTETKKTILRTKEDYHRPVGLPR